jgi:MFS family permease
LNSLISKMVLPSELGEVFGVNTSLNSLMTIIGPLTAGIFYDYIRPYAPYLLGAILLFVALLMIIRLKEPQATKIKI